MIVPPTILKTSGQISCNLGTSSSTKIYTETIQTVITALCVQKKTIFELCGIIGHKSYACIICGPNFLPTSLIRKMNQYNTLHGDEPTETIR